MDIILTVLYLVFSICVVYPPTEFVSAGFTLTQLFSDYMGSENTNFIEYHMKRITITALMHSALPLGYVICIWFTGVYGPWMLAAAAMTIIPLMVCFKIACWWEQDKSRHPAVKVLLPYVTPGADWRVVASNLNVEFWSVDKVSIQLTTNSKLVATENWLIKVGLYTLNVIKQSDCTLVATATDSHELSLSEEELQYINIQVISNRDDVKGFSFRTSTTLLRELQPLLVNPIRVPDHISLQPTLVERFVTVFKEYVDRNPIHYIDEEPELCIGCMQVPADVKITKRCLEPPEELNVTVPQSCQPCNCRVVWCCGCVARWWAARAGGGRATTRWLAGRCSCPVCRAPFCLLDVCPVRTHAQA